MDDAKLNEIVDAVVRQLIAAGAVSAPAAPAAVPPFNPPEPVRVSVPAPQPIPAPAPAPVSSFQTPVPNLQPPTSTLSIDLPDPASDDQRYKPRIHQPKDPAALTELIGSTPARIGVGRAGPRYNTASLLLFQGDHAVTQDALYRDIDQKLLDEFGLFTVQTKVTEGKEQYLLRPDLGRQLSEEAKRTLEAKCVKNANLQLVIGDRLSAAAIEANLRQILPVIKQGIQSAGLTFGTPFHVKYCRVGVMNDIGAALQPDVVILLIGERPGLGRAESMSAYMGYKPKYGDTDADRDVVCNIFENGGTNPLEAGAFVVQIAQKMRQHQASGVKLKLAAR
jgi:ethanolamine ammonia-lyase small subunit